jgi:hypothetical protein
MQDDLAHRRHAIQVVASLPEDPADALMVLELAKQLVSGFLSGNQAVEPTLERERGLVVSLSSANKGRNF